MSTNVKHGTTASPYRGIHPFRYVDQAYFYGRAEVVSELLAKVLISRLVLVFGESGTGKSSMINAGLIPALEREGLRAERLRLRPIQDEPILIERIQMDDGESDRFLPSIFVDGQSEEIDTSSEVVPCSLEHFRTAIDIKAADSHPVLIFDQFEELFTLFGQSNDKASSTEQELQAHIVEAIFQVVKSVVLKAKVMIIIREDFLGKLEILAKNYPQVFDQRVRLGYLDEIRSMRAILGPFEKKNLFASQLTPKLAERIIKDLSNSQPDVQIQPTQLQIICSRLWEKYASIKSQITVPDYIGLGEVKGILEGFLQSELTRIEPTQRSHVVIILGNLITEAGTRDVVSVDKLRGLVTSKKDIDQNSLSLTLRFLEERRLINRTYQRGTNYYEIASEYLIQPIQKEVLEQREIALQQERAEAAKRAAIEAAEREREAALHRETEQAQQRAEEKAEEARRLRRLTSWLQVASVVAVLATIFAVIQWWRAHEREGDARRAEDTARKAENDAKKSARLATSWRLATVADSKLATDPQLRLLIALHAAFETYSAGEGIKAEVQAALHNAVQAARARLPSLYHTLEVNAGAVNSIAFSPDGRFLATASQDGTAIVWDVASGRERHMLSRHRGPVTSIAFSPDGRFLATASQDETAIVWDVASGRERHILSRHRGPVTSIAFSPDGRFLATASQDETAMVWDAASGRTRRILLGHSGPVTGIAFSPDGRFLATGSEDATARVWDVASGKSVSSLYHRVAVKSLAFSPDGRFLATGSEDATARVWDVASGREAVTLTMHTDSENIPRARYAINSIAFSPDGRHLATTSADTTAKVWDVASRQLLNTLSERTGTFRSITYSADGRYLATAGDGMTAKVWYTPPGSAGAVDSITVSRNGQLLATANPDGTVEVWDTAIDQVVLTLLGITAPLISMTFSPDGKHLATVGRDGAVQVWNVASGQPVPHQWASTPAVISIAFSADGGRLATISREGALQVWDVTSDQIVLPSLGSTVSVISMAFSPDRKHLATVSRDGAVQVWDAASGHVVLDLSKTVVRSTSIAFSPDGGQLATANQEGTVAIWDITSVEKKSLLSGNTGPITAIAFCPDGRCLTTVSQNGTVKVWDTTSHEAKLGLSGDADLVTSVAFSLDGKHLAIVNQNGRVRHYTLDMKDLIKSAVTQIARELTTDECQDHLDPDVAQCPPAARALALVAAGKEAATSDKIEVARESFRKAQELYPSLPLDAEVEARRLAAGRLVAQGRSLASTGEVQAALESFRKAQELYPSLALDAEVEAKRLAAGRLVAQGRRLASTGEVQAAQKSLRDARELHPGLSRDLDVQVQRLAAPVIVEKGTRLVSLEKTVKEAIAAYKEAQRLDPMVQISAEAWNILCWQGSIQGYAKDVLEACDQAVTVEPSHPFIGNFRDSRGIARARTGDFKGAVEDFEAFIRTTTNNKLKSQRQRWVASLQADKNPFTRAEIESLRNQ